MAEKLNKKFLKRLAALLVSAVILYAIFSRIDLNAFGRQFTTMNWWWFGLSLLMFLPIYVIRPLLIRTLLEERIGFADSFGAVLAGSSLSMILPSKGGDLAKGYFVHRLTGIGLKTCFSAVILERVLDVTAIILLMMAGLFVLGDSGPYVSGVWAGGVLVLGAATFYFLVHLTGGDDSWGIHVFRRLPKISGFIDESRGFVRDLFRSSRIVKISVLSLTLWAVHVFQFYCFFQALGFQGPAITILAYVPAAIFIGLLPVSVAGIGTRDLALIAFFTPLASAELAAGVAILSHLRYILPALVGIPFMRSYLKDS